MEHMRLQRGAKEIQIIIISLTKQKLLTNLVIPPLSYAQLTDSQVKSARITDTRRIPCCEFKALLPMIETVIGGAGLKIDIKDTLTSDGQTI